MVSESHLNIKYVIVCIVTSTKKSKTTVIGRTSYHTKGACIIFLAAAKIMPQSYLNLNVSFNEFAAPSRPNLLTTLNLSVNSLPKHLRVLRSKKVGPF